MGVLYYFQKDAAPDLFALNKVYGYAPSFITYAEWRKPPSLEEVREAFGDRTRATGWPERFHSRLTDWAGGNLIRCISEYHFDVYDEEKKGEITGSAYDSDYREDGATYIPGSAW